MIEKTVTQFKQLYQAQPQHLVRAPGRVNLIGEHTDYNDGFVLPMAIHLGIWIALRPRDDQRVKVYSLNYDQSAEFSLLDLEHAEDWSDYLRGIAWALAQEGRPLAGWEGVLAGNIPLEAGLSSSAALEMAALQAFHAVADWKWDGITMAKIAQKAENSWVGVQSGIMDQMASALGENGNALLIDIRDLSHQPVPLIPGTRIMVLDTGTRRGLVDSVYNQRVAECQLAAEVLGLDSLRDATIEKLEGSKGQMERTHYRRARHVISENERTLKASEVMRQEDPRELGRLFNASHQSLRDDYQVSSPELDTMVAIARNQPGTYGARMTGAGFGGAAIALIPEDRIEDFSQAVSETYRTEVGLEPNIIPCQASQGAEQLV